MFYRAIADKLFAVLNLTKYGQLILTLPDGSERTFGGNHEGQFARATIHDWRTVTAFVSKGDTGLAEAYRDGWWYTDDLCTFLLFALENEAIIKPVLHGSPLKNRLASLLYLLRRNTIRGSRKNIQAHYDLGNDFYQLWLDQTMTYSSALYHSENESLEQAQLNKYDRLIDHLDHRSGRLLEVGCGWGGFAERAVSRSDCDFEVKGITLSQQQHEYANEKLQQRANIVLEDYRHQQGRYQNIVSIEMFEAVGEKFWPLYFKKLKTLLATNGKAMIQTITIADHLFDRYRRGGDMIRDYIFPGGMLPCPARFKQEAEKANLQVCEQFAFGEDYATTVKQWLNAFETNIEAIYALGYDEGFIRLWRFYLAACFAGFKVGRINVMHMDVRHA
ncbi:class I SAM-dependent methyltransferase [Gynuella sp.]|uniref:class I SAM-dependent methyltransferase n=1 Tax=Gynuella sp. TaxID=2969146 RepID=UPI003D11CE84